MDDRSLDDVLEDERDDKLQHSVGQNPLPEDNDTPAAQADDGDSAAGEHHPAQDSDVDKDTDETYQEG